MPQITEGERPLETPVSPAASPRAELDDAVVWLSQHLGFPAPSRQAYETRADRPRR